MNILLLSSRCRWWDLKVLKSWVTIERCPVDVNTWSNLKSEQSIQGKYFLKLEFFLTSFSE